MRHGAVLSMHVMPPTLRLVEGAALDADAMRPGGLGWDLQAQPGLSTAALIGRGARSSLPLNPPPPPPHPRKTMHPTPGVPSNVAAAPTLAHAALKVLSGSAGLVPVLPWSTPVLGSTQMITGSTSWPME